MEIHILLRIVGTMNIIPIFLIRLLFKRENPIDVISFKTNNKKYFYVGLYSDIYSPISFKFSTNV